MLQHLIRMIPIAVAGRPTVHLVLTAAGEPQEFVPVPLHEEQHPGDGLVLSIIGIAEGIPGHMNMQAAGARLMREVAHGDGSLQHRLPGHLMQLEIQ